MTAPTDACVFCQAVVPANTMEMTGHGLRCNACTQQSELAALQNKGNMGEHLTPDELVGIADGAQKGIVRGALLALGGAAATAVSFAIGSRIVILFTGAFLGGIGLMLHGMSVKKQAKHAQKQFPSARVTQT